MWPLLAYQETSAKSQELPELSLYIFDAELLSKYLEPKAKNVLGMELITDEIFIFLSLVNNDLLVYFPTVLVMVCESKCVGNTDLTNILYISVRATCTIKFNIM